jgi:hypothetical protein
VAACPGRARFSLVNRPNVEAAPSIIVPKYQKNTAAVKGLRHSEEKQRRHDGGEPKAVVHDTR